MSNLKTYANYKTPAWQRQEGKSDDGGLNEKGRNSYEKNNPGSDLKSPVTKENPSGKEKNRQDSYCDRSKGQKEKHNIDCRKDPDKPICKSRRKWKCSSTDNGWNLSLVKESDGMLDSIMGFMSGGGSNIDIGVNVIFLHPNGVEDKGVIENFIDDNICMIRSLTSGRRITVNTDKIKPA